MPAQKSKTPPLGSHMSIAGGYYKAVEAAAAAGCDCVQLFTKNNNQWRAKTISDEDASRFRDALVQHDIRHPLSHASYLINLATPDPELWQKSVAGMVVELQRAGQLGIPFVVVHPGAFTTASEAEGIANVARALDAIHQQVDKKGPRCLLETTAGQGSNLGWRFEQLAAMLDRVRHPERVGICLDTCHVFAAGYPLDPKRKFLATVREFDRIVGLDRLAAVHLNDSKRELGSRVDRHEHIGLGCLGLEPFRLLLNDRRFRCVPMYLETAKGTNDDGEDWDVVNLRTLRELVG